MPEKTSQVSLLALSRRQFTCACLAVAEHAAVAADGSMSFVARSRGVWVCLRVSFLLIDPSRAFERLDPWLQEAHREGTAGRHC